MNTKVTLGLVAMALASLPALAQSPAPIVVQAVTQGTVAPAAPAPIVANPTTELAIKALLEMKAANDEVMRKQAATLQQLEELERAAAQAKIFTKRG